MRPEFEIRINSRGGRSFEQLFVDPNIPLDKRVEIMAGYYRIPSDEILDVLGDVQDFLLEGKDSLSKQIEDYKLKHKRTRQISFITLFENRLLDMGISHTHAQRLVSGTINKLASLNYGEGSDFFERRLSLVNKLLEDIN